MTYVPVKCECGCVFWSATSHCPNCNAPVKPQARPIDANELVASLERSYKDLRELCDSIEEGEGAKEVYQGELITFLEAILRVREMPTLDYAPVRHGCWIRQDDTYTRFMCNVCELKNYPIKYSYCPNCGAKMDGGKHD